MNLRLCPLAPVLLLSAATVFALASASQSFGTARATSDVAPLAVGATASLVFEGNRGQSKPGVCFTAMGNGCTLELSPTQATVILTAKLKASKTGTVRTTGLPQVVRMSLLGASPSARGTGEVPKGRAHFLNGNRPEDWIKGIPTFGRVRFAGTYPGVDLVYYGAGDRLEYDFEVSPYAETNSIRLGFSDNLNVPLDTQVDSSGELLIHTAAGELRQTKPVLYQEIDGERRDVSGEWVAVAKGEASFRVGQYDPRAPLVIDPALRYFADPGAICNSVAVDGEGFAYVSGAAYKEVEPNYFALDSFVRKFTPDGASMVYSATFGGKGTDFATGIAVDGTGAALVTGSTDSLDFPTVNPIQPSLQLGPGGVPAEDAFLLKLSPTGEAIEFATYFGGSERENVLLSGAIGVDQRGDAYISGDTGSLDFPVLNAVQPQSGNPIPAFFGLGDAFLAKIDPIAGRLVYSTYIGGWTEDGATAIAVSPEGEPTITGVTLSDNFPLKDAAQPRMGGDDRDAFVTRFSANGELVYSTYLGGAYYDIGLGVAVDNLGAAYVAGNTFSRDFPVVSPFQGLLNGGSENPFQSATDDGFVAKLSSDGQAIQYSTYLGGSDRDVCTSIRVDGDGSIVVGGATLSNDFPVIDSPQRDGLRRDSDGFLVRMDSSGAALSFSAYLGGDATEDYVFGLALDRAGNQFMAGMSEPIDPDSEIESQQRGMASSVASGVSPSPRARAFINRVKRKDRRGPGRLAISTSRLQFKSGRPGPQSLALRIMNAGRGPLSGRVGTVKAPFSIATGGGTFSLGGGETHLVVVQFEPSGSTATGRLLIESTRPSRARKQVSLVARGRQRAPFPNE